MKRIGIISDTHNKLPEEAIALLEGCDRLIHAGDICRPDILWQLECVAPLIAVLGNNDHADLGPSVHPQASFVEEGVRFVIVHEPRHLKGALQSYSHERELPVVAVHGHIHVPKIEYGESALYDYLVCPGAVNRSRGASGRRTVAFVDVDAGCVKDIRIVSLDGDVIEHHSDKLEERRQMLRDLDLGLNIPNDLDIKKIKEDRLVKKYGEHL